MITPLNTLGFAHHIWREQIAPGSFCIDATAGKGRDTLLLCRLAGPQGRVAALDVQPEAIAATADLLRQEGMQERAGLILDSHANLSRHFAPESADAIVFNLGWLPGFDHSIRTTEETTLPALEQSLEILRPGGLLSVCIYYGGLSGYRERDAVLEWFASADSRRYTSLVCSFANRGGDPPIPAFLWKA